MYRMWKRGQREGKEEAERGREREWGIQRETVGGREGGRGRGGEGRGGEGEGEGEGEREGGGRERERDRQRQRERKTLKEQACQLIVITSAGWWAARGRR